MSNKLKINRKELTMDKKEIKIELWSDSERYKNYISNNLYKEPLEFRPHPANVVRDVIMYHIYQNEGQILCEDTLVQYIKNKIINDLNEIFMLYQYAPDAIKTIDRLMSSKRHLGTEDSYHEMMFHALTTRDARDVLIEQISNVLIKCIPEPLGNIKFDTIMKDEIMNDNTKESSIEEDIRNDREVRIENREKEFLNCKSETEKIMLFPRHDLVRLAVDDIITDAVERYQNESHLVFEAQLKGEMKHISKETIVSSFIFLAMGHIKQTFIVNDDVEKQIEKSVEHILNDSLNNPTREKGIDYITTIIWYSSYDAYFKKLTNDVKEVDNNQQRFQVGDLVSFEEGGWYYQSLIHGTCYHKVYGWSYVIVVFDEFRRITESDVDKLTLLKKAENIVDTESHVTEVTKQKMLSVKHGGKAHSDE